MSADKRLSEKLAELGLTMPAAPQPKGFYKPLLQHGDLIFTAGHLPITPDDKIITGRLGENLSVEEGQRAALWSGLGILASLKAHLGSLDRVKQVVKIFGLINSTPDFTQQPAVLNGASELIAAVFGLDHGVGARSAVGTNVLPLGAAVEVEAIVALHQ